MSVRTAVLLSICVTCRPSSAQQPTALERAARYSAARDGDAVLAYRHDSLVVEDYENGYNGREGHGLASGTKAFACALVALGQSDRLFQLDQPLSRYLADFRGDPVRAGITLRQMLSLTSGIVPDIDSPDDVHRATTLPLETVPGQHFAYGGAAFHVLDALLTERLKGDAVAYLSRRVLAPLGIAADWVRDPRGHPNLASGAVLTARGWGQYGLLLLHHGAWQGRQILPAASVAECLKGSDANPWFGLGLWLNAREPSRPAAAGVMRVGLNDRRLYAPDLPADIAVAAGTAGQRLYIVPGASLVIVRLGHNTGPEFKDDEFLRIALGKAAP